MKNFSRKVEPIFPFQLVFLGYVGILAGIYLLYELNIWGLLLLLVSLFISFSHAGIQLDFTKNSYKEYLGLIFLKFGKWKTLPDIQYVTVFVDRSVQEMHVVSISNAQTLNDLKINLVIAKNSYISLGKFKNKTEGMKTGHLLASNLNTKLLDYTTAKPEWVSI